MSEADSRLGASMQSIAAESGKSYGAVKGGGGGDEGGMNDLYKVNQIYFRMLPTLSLVAKRTLLVNFAQKTSYTGVNDTIVFNFNTGEFYISATSSYMYIQCGYNSPTAYSQAKALLATGNIISLFEEVTFTSASGTEICRELNKGLNHAITYRYNNSQEYIDTIGAIQGAPVGAFSRIHDGVTSVRGTVKATYSLAAMFPCLGGAEGCVLPRSGPASIAEFGIGCTNLNVYSTGVDVGSVLAPDPTACTNIQLLEFCVPLDQLLGLFKPYLGTLFPAGALSGGRLEIRMKNTAESLQFIAPAAEIPIDGPPATVGFNTNLKALVNASNTSFQIANTYLVLDAFQLQDNVLKRLNQVAAGQDGLTVLFDTYDQVVTSFPGTGTVECQVQQARSRIVRSWCVVRDNQQITNPYVNSLCSEAGQRRVCAKVQYGATVPTAFRPADTAGGGTGATCPKGFGGGLSYSMLLATGTAANTPTLVVTPNTAGNLGTMTVFEKQPALPDDPFIADNPYGQPTVSSYQANLGALYFPQQPISTLVEHYQNALYMWGKGIPDKDNTCSVTYEDFKGGLGNHVRNSTTPFLNVDPTIQTNIGDPLLQWVAPYGLAVYGFLAEKSQALQLSGLPISNARLLRHRLTFTQPSSSGIRQITTFTQFSRVMKTFLGGRVVVRE